ncbi:MAG: molybdopterin-dependent oxidoreductase [Candidatus Eremiobacteraeota bacterium]|nr:molybdopterin-dependent oxidoreductase [Candidatus Eremiobacteraeota bacterium]
MAEVKVNINDKEILADNSKTILQVVRENNLDEIPTLCYEERLGQITSCFICVVEVEGARGLVPSCSTKITNGMVIRTNTEKVRETRKTCLELIFSNHYADCISPCAQKCPAGIDIQGYLSLVKKGLYKEAIELIKERNPLPIVCGRICVRECEVGCRRNLLDEPVAIDFLKRYAAESREGMQFHPEVKPSNGKSVGVVGGGPAGLSAAYYLSMEGYKVTVYEAMPEAGGMLRYGIPAYRLPKDLLDIEIESIEKMGVKVLCNKRIGKDMTLEDLRNQYDAVLLTVGAWGAMGMRVENEDSLGVLSGLDVLRQVANGELKELRGRVLVIGGGNTAIDASRTSVRLGADDTAILYRRTETEMPAHHEEIEAARAEGVDIKFLISPQKAITDKNGRVTGLECIRMELGEPDASGRPRPIPIEGSNYIEPADYIVAAIGQFPDLKCLEPGGNGECPVELSRRGRIVVNNEDMSTNIPGVFSAGDVVTGPATVIEGIAGGRKSAYAIHNRLSGKNVKVDTDEFVVNMDMFAKVTCEDVSCFECSPRHKMPERDPEERIRDFREVELGLSRQDIIEEADRCFQCGCLEVDECLLRKYGEEYEVDPTHYLGEVNRYEVDRRHPFVLIDPNKCILCGRCIKTCEKILDAPALGFVNRGFKTIIAPSMEKPLADTNCISCGNCIDTCPTGALSENQPLFARIGSGVEDHPAICSFCPVGCRINIKTFGRDMRIRSRRDKVTGYGDYLCRRGRFGSRYLNSDDRIVQPATMKEGKIHYSEWDRALKETAGRLGEIRDKYGPDSIAVFISPKMTNEEIYAAVRFAKGVISTDLTGSYNDLFHGRKQHEIDHMFGHTVSTNPMDDVFESDVIILVNSDPTETHPSFGRKIRDARKKGAKLIVINSNRIDPVKHADLWLQPRRGTNTHVLSAIMNEIIRNKAYDEKFVEERTNNFEALKNFLKGFIAEDIAHIAGVLPGKMKKAANIITDQNPNVMVIYDHSNPIDRAVGDMEALSNLLSITGNIGKKGSGLILLQKHSNSVGLYDMGAEPGFLPGRVNLEDSKMRKMTEKVWGTKLPAKPSINNGDIKDIFLSGKIKAVLVIGEDPLENPAEAKYFRKLHFLAVMDLFKTETARYADIILPASTHIESGGSFTRLDRKVQKFPPAFPAPSGKTNLEVICELASLMGSPMKFENNEEVFEEIKKINPLYTCVTPGDEEKGCSFWNTDCKGNSCEILYRNEFATPDGKTQLSAYRVGTRTFHGEEFNYNVIEARYNSWIKKLFLKGKVIPVSV